MIELQRTGIEGLDRLIGGIPRGSRNLIYGPPGTGKTVFAMQFLWTGLQQGETVSYDVFDRPWTHMRRYFASFGWDITPYEQQGKFIPIQAFPHPKEYPKDPLVRYFSLADFNTMQEIDLDLSRAGVTRFVAGDNFEHVFTSLSEEQWMLVEHWTINWCHHDGITNVDIMTEVRERDPVTNRLMDFTFSLAHNIFRFRLREVNGKLRRELRIEKMEGVAHPLEWLPFEITPQGIVMME